MKPNTGRRGMTLAEIMVCLAVVAVVAAMVVSFAMMMSDRTQISRARLEMQQDLTMVETVTENWLEQMSAKDATFTVTNSTITATVTENETAVTYTLYFVSGTLTGNLPEGKTMTVRAERVNSIGFTAQDEDGDWLFFCNVTCLLPQAGTTENREETVTFAINPRAGETVGGST